MFITLFESVTSRSNGRPRGSGNTASEIRSTHGPVAGITSQDQEPPSSTGQLGLTDRHPGSGPLIWIRMAGPTQREGPRWDFLIRSLRLNSLS